MKRIIMSLSDYKVTAVVPVSDLERAALFYESVLGLNQVADVQYSSDSVVYSCGGDTTVEIYVSPTGAGASGATVATWAVSDIEAVADDLRDTGITFEEYNFDEFSTVNGVMTLENGSKAAWFKDPDGNFLCLHQDLA